MSVDSTTKSAEVLSFSEFSSLLTFLSEEAQQSEKSKDQILALSELMEEVKEDVAGEAPVVPSSSSGTFGSSNSVGSTTGGPSIADLSNAMAEMTAILTQLQVALVRFAQNKSNIDVQLSQSQIDALNKSYEKLTQQLQALAAQQKRAKGWELAGKILSGLAIAAGAVMLFIPGMQLMGVMMIAMSVLSLTGVTGKFTTWIATKLEDAGMSQTGALILAVAITFILAAVLTFGAGAAGGLLVGGTAGATASAANVLRLSATSMAALMQVSLFANLLSSVSGGIVGIGSGTIQIEQGKIMLQMADIQGNLILQNGMLGQIHSGAESSQKYLSQLMQVFAQMTSSFSRLSAGQQELAQVLVQG